MEKNPSQSGLRAAASTDVGSTRSENQDACTALRLPSGALLLVVADGMGGHQGGATASRLAIETIREVAETADVADVAMLRSALELANERVHAASRSDIALAGMGTTCVALLLAKDGTSFVAHVGDSRAYRLREGQLEALTEDHSAVAELVRNKTISLEEAAVHPHRSVILRNLGAEPAVEVDVAEVAVLPGDRFLLCSDGLSGVVGELEMAELLEHADPDAASRLLIDRANHYGGPDNVTAVVADVGESEPAAAAPATGPSRQVLVLALACVLVAVVLGLSLLVLLRAPAEPAAAPSAAVTTAPLAAP